MRPPRTLLWLTRLSAALTDPARRERSVPIALAVYAVLWTLYGTIAKASQGLHYDMAEQIAWARDLAWGFDKHPPLAAALVWLWFKVVPVAEWSFYLLAMLMPALALWIVWRLSSDYLDIEKRVIGLALLTLVPFFNFHALKYNVNTVLLPLWAATTFAFLRSYRTRGTGWAALAGLAAAASMLGKYWSVVLLIGLGLAALIDRRRGRYFRSPAPWITVAVGLVALAPHLLWLARHDFAPFTYAFDIHANKPLADSLMHAFGYLAGSLGYAAAPIVIVFIILRSSPRQRAPRAENARVKQPSSQSMAAFFADMVWPTETQRRLVAAALWAPLLLPVVLAPVTGVEITSLWSMSAWTLLPILLLSPPALIVQESDTVRVLGLAITLPLIMLIASPAIAILAQRAGPLPSSAQARLLAQEVERDWHVAIPQPLRFVGGNADLAYGVVAYAVEEPRALPDLPQPSLAELRRDGVVYVCFAEDTGCRQDAAAKEAKVGPGRTVDLSITRNFLRFAGKPQRYTIIIVPPRR